MSTNKPERVIRQEKLSQLLGRGINPFPNQTPAHSQITQAKQHKAGAKLAIVGRIGAIRSHGKSTFFDLVEDDQKLQVYAKLDELGQENYELLELLDVGDYLWAEGELFVTKAGELSLKIIKWQLLSKSLAPIPDSWHGLTDIETRYRARALDFKINPEARKIIATRSQIIHLIRQFLDTRGFLEIQTPILQPLAGGATAKPFTTHHNALDSDFYLRISKELYLKRLVVGGFERVYEIGPDFRNEGLSHMHNPEFTMCEFYWAYQTAEGLMKVTEQLIKELVKKVHGELELTYRNQMLDFSDEFRIVTYDKIIEKETGIKLDENKTVETLSATIKKVGIKLETETKVWSELVDELFKKAVRPKIIQPTFVIDYPAEPYPLAKRHEQNPDKANMFQLIMAGGFELVKAYSELNNPVEQATRFREQLAMRDQGWEEAQLFDQNYIEALEYGLPPTAGWGLGIDRLVMVLTDQHSIKEVIPFPTLRPNN